MRTINQIKAETTEILKANLKVAEEQKNLEAWGCVVFFPSTFLIVNKIEGKYTIGGNVVTPTKYSVNEGVGLTETIRNGHGERPICKDHQAYFSLLETWLKDQIVNVENL
jgi:hypothetical protein